MGKNKSIFCQSLVNSVYCSNFLLTCLTIQQRLLQSPHCQIPETTNSPACICVYLYRLVLGLTQPSELWTKGKNWISPHSIVVSTKCGFWVKIYTACACFSVHSGMFLGDAFNVIMTLRRGGG